MTSLSPRTVQRCDWSLPGVEEEKLPRRSADRLPSLDGFRAVSIVLVLISHLSYAAKVSLPYLDYGDLGVRCFFVISGFLITFLFLREESLTGSISLWLFYSRRFLRIVPVYVTFVAFVALLGLVAGFRVPTCNWVTTLTYTKDFGCAQWIDGHLWSLSVEEQFYLFWPLVLISFGPKARMSFALALICICPIVRIAYYVLRADGYYSPFTNADTLMFGCAAAMLLNRYGAEMRRALNLHSTAGRLLGILIIAVPQYLSVNFKLGILTVPFAWSMQALGVVYLILSYVVVPNGFGYSFLNAKPVRFVGIISYSLYIWQQPFFMHPEDYHIGDLPMFRFPMNAACAFVVATCSWYCLERPLAAFRRRLHPDVSRRDRGGS